MIYLTIEVGMGRILLLLFLSFITLVIYLTLKGMNSRPTFVLPLTSVCLQSIAVVILVTMMLEDL